ncbi:hypothetical protein OG588_00365 [Streptomyces prunicolor]|uniref:hypothetical protein n=1 Tax=Streptomyces prunicolor TaxID=67348 RepID=UPI0038667463|nr:hypothetical protein OG588_00365 [Streptomyces prunicolor]
MSRTPPEPKSGAPSDCTDGAGRPAGAVTGPQHIDVPPAGERHPEPTPAAPGVPADDTTADPACADDSYSGYEPL